MFPKGNTLKLRIDMLFYILRKLFVLNQFETEDIILKRLNSAGKYILQSWWAPQHPKEQTKKSGRQKELSIYMYNNKKIFHYDKFHSLASYQKKMIETLSIHCTLAILGWDAFLLFPSIVT